MNPPGDTIDPHAGRPLTTTASGDETTGLPWLGTWRDVYVFVFVSFVIWVGLLVALTVTFS
jgi:hypothetical protein